MKVIRWQNMGKNSILELSFLIKCTMYQFLPIENTYWGSVKHLWKSEVNWSKVKVTWLLNRCKNAVLEPYAHCRGGSKGQCVTQAYCVNLQSGVSYRCCSIQFYLVCLFGWFFFYLVKFCLNIKKLYSTGQITLPSDDCFVTYFTTEQSCIEAGECLLPYS